MRGVYMPYSEIRDSTKVALFDKVRKQDYGKYLHKVFINKIRAFESEGITFEFPVTALIGPNGGGKSSILGAAACAYKDIKPGMFFPKSTIGDNSMSGWKIEYEAVDKAINPRQLVKRNSSFNTTKWVRGDLLDRPVLFFGIERTVPAGEKSKYQNLKKATYRFSGNIEEIEQAIASQIEKVLGKSVNQFRVAKLDTRNEFFIGNNNGIEYSEFHFGAGESSIIRMIEKIESAPTNTLVLIEEIENGLHPVATRRMVEYLIDVAERKGIQAIFTTHSDYALDVLPSEAIWASLNGRIKQGRLSVEALRAVAGRIDKKLAVFLEDDFAKAWFDAIIREYLGEDAQQIETYAVAGDGNAVSTHKYQVINPAVSFKSMCIIDGDSQQSESVDEGIHRLPGAQPELTVYKEAVDRLDSIIALLTVSCQRAPEYQEQVRKAVLSVLSTNRDPHLLFNQLGIEIGWVPEVIVRGAFLSLWIRKNSEYCEYITSKVKEKLT